MKHIAILGSTGSIGISTLDVINRFTSGFKAIGLSTNSRVDILYRQIKKHKPRYVCVNEPDKADCLKKKLKFKIKIFSGEDGLLQMLEDPRIDQVVLAITGSAALKPLLKAIENGKDVALANKEALVMAGPIIMERARRKNVRVIPVDSEQSAIWQCLTGQDNSRLKYIYLTASGGPFRKLDKNKFKGITVRQALSHPRWKMGKKITVDSATLMNKGLEVLEAVYLFGVPVEKVKIVIHPESIIHSMVEFVDGVILAQLSVTDMVIPIQYALTYPDRRQAGKPGVDFYRLGQLNFERPDFSKFPCLKLAYRAASEGGTTPCVLNAANEICVSGFLKGVLKFTAIPKVIEKVLDRHKNTANPQIKDILDSDIWAKEEARSIIERMR